MLASQAGSEGLTLLTADEVVAKHPGPIRRIEGGESRLSRNGDENLNRRRKAPKKPLPPPVERDCEVNLKPELVPLGLDMAQQVVRSLARVLLHIEKPTGYTG